MKKIKYNIRPQGSCWALILSLIFLISNNAAAGSLCATYFEVKVTEIVKISDSVSDAERGFNLNDFVNQFEPFELNNTRHDMVGPSQALSILNWAKSKEDIYFDEHLIVDPFDVRAFEENTNYSMARTHKLAMEVEEELGYKAIKVFVVTYDIAGASAVPIIEFVALGVVSRASSTMDHNTNHRVLIIDPSVNNKEPVEAHQWLSEKVDNSVLMPMYELWYSSRFSYKDMVDFSGRMADENVHNPMYTLHSNSILNKFNLSRTDKIDKRDMQLAEDQRVRDLAGKSEDPVFDNSLMAEKDSADILDFNDFKNRRDPKGSKTPIR